MGTCATSVPLENRLDKHRPVGYSYMWNSGQPLLKPNNPPIQRLQASISKKSRLSLTTHKEAHKGGKKDLDIYDENVIKFNYKQQIVQIQYIKPKKGLKPNEIQWVTRDKFVITIRYLDKNSYITKDITCASISFAKYVEQKLLSFMSLEKIVDTNANDNKEEKGIDTNDDAFTPRVHVDCELSAKAGDCEIIKRIMDALKNYESMDEKELEEKYDEFCKSSLLDDYIHIVSCHNNDLDEIAKKQGCDVTNCEISKTFNRRRYCMDKQQPEIETKMGFWKNILDGMHCYLFHLYDYGFRIRSEDLDVKSEDNDVNVAKVKSVPSFKDVFKIVQQKKKKVSAQMKIDSHKYDIHPLHEPDITFTDALFEELKTHRHISHMPQILQTLMDEAYDTDAIEIDLDGNIDSSNIAQLLNLESDARIVRDYIVHCHVTKNSFSIGYTFFYWDYYDEEQKQFKHSEKEKHFGNRNDLRGHKPHELYVKRKYNCLKEEILQNEIFNLGRKDFKISSNKANQYMTTKRVKCLKSATFADKRLHYGIEAGEAIRKGHILAIILRCDWTELCTAFTGTFRKNQPFESLASIKDRNEEYANWSRLLREAVEYYGGRAEGDYDKDKEKFIGQVKGPFYCGINHAMAMPEFNIRLCGPTSTTMQVEVAARFGGSEGILIQLNTSGHCNADLLRSMSCSWLSNFNEEDERLFVGGQYPIRIESITHLETQDNFSDFCRSLFYFDCMVKGITMDEDNVKIKKIDKLALERMINHHLKINEYQNQYPNYINDTFQALVDTPTEIVVNLHELHTSFAELKYLIIGENNLVNQQLLELFKNAKEMSIYSTKPNGMVDYVIDLSQLFSFIKSSLFKMQKDFKITINATRFEWNQEKPSWLKIAYDELIKKEEHSKDTENQMIDLTMKETSDHEGVKQDCLVIKIKSTHND